MSFVVILSLILCIIYRKTIGKKQSEYFGTFKENFSLAYNIVKGFLFGFIDSIWDGDYDD
jgi:hypothetical protein